MSELYAVNVDEDIWNILDLILDADDSELPELIGGLRALRRHTDNGQWSVEVKIELKGATHTLTAVMPEDLLQHLGTIQEGEVIVAKTKAALARLSDDERAALLAEMKR